MNRNSKKLALATLAFVVVAASLNSSPAEARRYRHKVVRSPAVTHVTPPHYLGSSNIFAPMWGEGTAQAPRSRVAHYGRGWRGQRYAAPRQRYAAQRVPRVARPAYAAMRPASPVSSMGFGGGGLVAQARQYVGTNPTGMGALWCARFMNLVLEKSGRRGTGSNMANSFANYGTRVSGPQVGAIAVMSRGKRGGHVGIVSGVDAAGNPVVISGNYNRRVAETVIPRGRIYAYVMP
ncbi:MAG: TIGR02594 family protein [Pseudorhodoplanes sp.]